MLVGKIFFDPFFYVLKKFLCPEKFEQGIIKKKLSTQAKNFEKIIVQVGNVPPPPITFLMVHPLTNPKHLKHSKI